MKFQFLFYFLSIPTKIDYQIDEMCNILVRYDFISKCIRKKWLYIRVGWDKPQTFMRFHAFFSLDQDNPVFSIPSPLFHTFALPFGKRIYHAFTRIKTHNGKKGLLESHLTFAYCTFEIDFIGHFLIQVMSRFCQIAFCIKTETTLSKKFYSILWLCTWGGFKYI